MSTFNPTIRSTRLFAASVALHDALSAVAWPTHPLTGTAPSVELSLDQRSTAAETVTVLTEGNDTFAEWTQVSSATRTERITIEVAIRSAVPTNFDRRALMLRLGELSDAAHTVLYDTDLGQPKPIGFGNEMNVGLVESAQAQIINGDDRITGVVVLRFVFQARI